MAATAHAAKQYGPGNFRLEEATVGNGAEGSCAVHVRMPDWPYLVVAGRGATWEEALGNAAAFRLHIHREPGWCIPEIGEHSSDYAESFKRDLLSLNHASATGMEKLFGIHKDIPFEAEVGKPFVDREDGKDYGVVLAILRLQPNLLGIVTSRRGFAEPDPILVGEAEVVDQVTYRRAAVEWEQKKRRRRR